MKKIILITGASSGIGKDTALKLIQQGHHVYGASRRLEKMQEISEAGGHALKLDVTKGDQLEAAVDRIIGEQGRIDVLINNAGYGSYGSVEETTIEDARYQFEVNLFGPARLTQLVLPHMRKQGAGKIINVSSMGGKVYTPLGAWYHATKHALEGWSDCLRLEVKQHGIDVVIVQPGIIETEFGDVMMGPMLERSGDGPYKELAHSLAKATTDSYSKGNASPPSVVTKTILEAVASSNPKTRYVTGKLARPVMLARKFLGDRLFDRMIMSQI